MPTCPFNHHTFSFEGTPVNQARCLLRKVLPLGNVGNTPAVLPTILENMVGQPCDITRAQLASYLVGHGIAASAIGGELDQPVSTTNGSAGPATGARYFVIHDTSFPHRPGHFTAATATFPASVNTAEWSGNNLSHANGMTTHVMLARTGLSATSTNYRTRLRATKREKREFPDNTEALTGLFLHHELVQPRLNNMNPAGIDEFSPTPGFTPVQYERLAVCYYATAVRSGTFLIPLFHCVLDLDISGGHDDPQKFDLNAWGLALQAVRTAITGVGGGILLGGEAEGIMAAAAEGAAAAALGHGIINSPDGEANVRSGPSQNHEILAVLQNGEGVDIFARSGQWRRIAPSQEQWVHGSLIAITGGDTPLPVDTAELVATLKEKPGGAGALRNVKILKLNSRPGFCYKAAMAIDVDGSPRAYSAGATEPTPLDGPESVDAEGFATMYIQQRQKTVNGVKRVGEGPHKDFFVSRTSLLFKSGEAHKCSNFVDAETIPYVVFPDKPGTFSGVALGDMAYVIDLHTGRSTHAIFADTNPKVGEASLCVAQNLGRSDLNAGNGEEADRFVYIIFPGTRFAPLDTVPHWPDGKIKEEADKAFAAWGGMEQVRALFA
jgi:hypothetical protein